MLNISENSISEDVAQDKWSGLTRVNQYQSGRLLLRLLTLVTILFLVALFLPWTQHIRAKGKVTTLLPQQRPQSINTIIPGQIEEWFVREGNEVSKGDTILHLSEVKNEYFDPLLLDRTENQIVAKSATAQAYQSKANALDEQIAAIAESRGAELEQAYNKLEQSRLAVLSDSINLEAKRLNLTIAKDQYDRQLQLYNKGLKSLTDLEKRRLALQKAEAEEMSVTNKLQSSRAAIAVVIAQINGIEANIRKVHPRPSQTVFQLFQVNMMPR